jgi:predicted Zn-dependent peptidase
MYEKITLPNGVRIVHENIPYVRSAALGIWVGTGSRYEKARMSGASHFIEHMLFKGTQTRSAADLADIMDGIGGQVNAFTTKECTCFHGRVLDTHLDQLTDVLCDMFFNSRFDEGDVKNERGVILEEIDMYRDTPEDLASERLQTAVYKGFSLSRPVLGTKAALGKMTGEALREHMAGHYRPRAVVVALSGSYKPADIERLKARFADMGAGGEKSFKPAAYTPSFLVKRKSLEQNHLMLTFPGLGITDERRYTLQLLSDILGGGMSSRLFQTVREQRGLCYSVYTYGYSYLDTGLFAVYTALGRENGAGGHRRHPGRDHPDARRRDAGRADAGARADQGQHPHESRADGLADAPPRQKRAVPRVCARARRDHRQIRRRDSRGHPNADGGTVRLFPGVVFRRRARRRGGLLPRAAELNPGGPEKIKCRRQAAFFRLLPFYV